MDDDEKIDYDIIDQISKDILEYFDNADVTDEELIFTIVRLIAIFSINGNVTFEKFKENINGWCDLFEDDWPIG